MGDFLGVSSSMESLPLRTVIILGINDIALKQFSLAKELDKKNEKRPSRK